AAGAPPAGGPPAGGAAGGPPAAGAGGGAGRFPGGGFGMGRGGGDGAGRWFVNLQYTYELKNEVLIAPGIPVLDLLDRDGNQARHSANLRVGTFYKGFGVIWNGQYTGSSVLGGTGLAGSSDLLFNDYATLNFRAFADLGQQASLVEAVPFLKGTRIGFAMDNLFDTRQRVTDSAGNVPLRYQPFLIDPIGRSFEIEFRKVF
ncbi:TonB-dependent receptor, partial [Altererythrobacter buctensis]|nr:TonB-dependent receptor [Alteraurantiacibacter buctensis]